MTHYVFYHLKIWYPWQQTNMSCSLLLELKLVSHFLANRYEFFTQATLIILLKKSGFQFLVSTLGVELCGIKLWDCVPQRTHST